MNLLFKEKKEKNGEDVYELTAVSGKKTVGRLEYRRRSRLRIHSIEVPEEYRNQGVGSALVHNLALKGIEDGRYMIEAFLTEDSDLGYFLWRCGLEPVNQNEKGTHYALLLNRPADNIKEDSVRVLQERILSLSEEDNTDDSESDDLSQMDYESLTDLDSGEQEGTTDADKDDRFTRFASAVEFDPVTNADLICGSCIYRTTGKNVMSCHKYADKPYKVLTDDECEFYLG